MRVKRRYSNEFFVQKENLRRAFACFSKETGVNFATSVQPVRFTNDGAVNIDKKTSELYVFVSRWQ